MRLSSGFVWRYREWERFRAECPGGDPALQRLVWERLDEALAWLESLGAPVADARDREPADDRAPLRSRRADRDALAARAGEVRLGEPLRELPDGTPVVLATGGFQGDRELVRRHVTPEADALVLRANPWSSGDGLRLGLEAGGVAHGGMDEFYGPRPAGASGQRSCPASSSASAQLYARFATRQERDRGGVRAPHVVGDRRRRSGPRGSRTRAPPTRCRTRRSASASGTGRSAR